jgi:hypothetical protein
MSIIQDYKEFYCKYNQKFGEKICVLVNNENEKTYDLYKSNSFGNIEKIAKILKLEIKSSNETKEQYLLSSFPSTVLFQAIPILMASFYTVIILKKNNNNKLDISAIYFPENMNFGGFVF